MISNCGELPEENLHMTNHCDGTSDVYPLWPQDWDIDKDNLDVRLLSFKIIIKFENSTLSFVTENEVTTSTHRYKKFWKRIF